MFHTISQSSVIITDNKQCIIFCLFHFQQITSQQTERSNVCVCSTFQHNLRYARQQYILNTLIYLTANNRKAL